MDYMAEERCPNCNALYALVGYRHRCLGQAERGVVGKALHKSVILIDDPHTLTGKEGWYRGGSQLAPATYRYRDPDKRREAVRKAVRKHRANAKTDRPPPS